MKENVRKKLVGRLCNYCCVLGRKNAFSDKNREKTNMSLFSVPEREKSKNGMAQCVEGCSQERKPKCFLM